MWRPGFDYGDFPSPERELLLATLEAERPVDHGEALALGGMNMRGSNEAVRLNRAFDHDRLAVRIGRRGVKRDALPGDRIENGVSRADHLCCLLLVVDT